MAKLSALFVLVVSIGLVLACQPPDCDTPDCGSCSNACCTINFNYDMTADKVNDAITTSLKAGGADGRYTYVNGYDYRSEHMKSGVAFLLQGIHRTLVHHYNDTLDFLILSTPANTTTVQGFSISRIAGALCDEGQNYKNLVGFFKGLPSMYKDMKVVWGCTEKFH